MSMSILNKHGYVTTDIARTLMSMEVGDRLPTIIELTEAFSVSRGIVQNAISLLEESGCIKLNRSGKLGTVLAAVNYVELYKYTDWDPIVGAMPVPFNASFRSLASALFVESRNMPVSSTIVYVSGALNRQALLKKDFLDYIVTSVAASKRLLAEDNSLELLFELPECQYESPYCLLFINPAETEIRDGMKLGVDYDTIDQLELTKALCRGKSVELVNMPFERTIEMLHDHSIDCSVIRREKWLMDNLSFSPRELPKTDYPAEETTVPAVIINKNSFGMKAFLQKHLSPPRIAKAQRQALEIHGSYKY